MQQNYLVLARKYRPTDFSGLKGQDFLVTTIVNAIKLNRLAHTFLLTGIRGSGKTTTARIIARTINCSNPILEEKLVLPCKTCQNCTASLSDKHPDIIELDAASRTGVDDARSIIENANYLPLMGKYKVYIIDEVHMLSASAFNALLKTLEEPPAHVKFIFATTELRKIPITILSRCQKFELRRQTSKEIADNLKEIILKEGIEAEESAINLISTHSEGSVRDSLSLLDMVISNANNSKINFNQVKDLLGLADSSKVIEIFLLIVQGDAAETIKIIDEIYYSGKDITLFLQHLLELINELCKIALNINSELNKYSDNEIENLRNISSSVSISTLTILWQIILKALHEMQYSYNQKLFTEMLMIKLCYLSKIPNPAELMDHINNSKDQSSVKDINNPNENINNPKKKLHSYEDLVALFYQNKEMLLYEYLINDVKPINFEPPTIKLHLSNSVPTNFINKIASLLKEYTGEKWTITTCAVGTNAEDTLAIKAIKLKEEKAENLKKNEIVAEVFKEFPASKIKDINPKS